MNDYTLALYQEIAAQKAGYEPSPMWGRITNEHEHERDRKHFEASMSGFHSHGSHIDRHIRQEVNKYVNKHSDIAPHIKLIPQKEPNPHSTNAPSNTIPKPT